MTVKRKPATDLAAAGLRALKRAAKNALELARQIGTACYVLENGKIVDIAKRGRAKKKKRRSA